MLGGRRSECLTNPVIGREGGSHASYGKTAYHHKVHLNDYMRGKGEKLQGVNQHLRGEGVEVDLLNYSQGSGARAVLAWERPGKGARRSQRNGHKKNRAH